MGEVAQKSGWVDHNATDPTTSNVLIYLACILMTSSDVTFSFTLLLVYIHLRCSEMAGRQQQMGVLYFAILLCCGL